jgi:hypothetical protein
LSLRVGLSAVVILPPPRTIFRMSSGRAPWPLKRSETKQRKMAARLLYDLEVEYRKVGWGDPAYVHDEECELFRFRDGRFAFSREHTDWALLRKRGRLRGWQ